MFLTKILAVVVFYIACSTHDELGVTGSAQQCPSRDRGAADRVCKRQCEADGGCRRANRICVCDGFCGMSCLRRHNYTRELFPDYTEGQLCPNRRVAAGRTCERRCETDESCKKKRRMCVCDGYCGMSCLLQPDDPEETCPIAEVQDGMEITYPAGQPYVRGSFLVVTCEPEKVLIGESVSVCQNGEWTPAVASCREKERCPKVETQTYDVVLYDGAASTEEAFTDGTVVTVGCGSHQYVSRNGSSVCRNGVWEPAVPSCISYASCPTQDHEEDRYITYLSRQPFLHGTVLAVWCYGREVLGEDLSVCHNGTWAPAVATCGGDPIPEAAPRPCRLPQEGWNVRYFSNGESIPVNDVHLFYEGYSITSRCDDPTRQRLTGSTERVCRDGRWGDGAVSCVASNLVMAVGNTFLQEIVPNGTIVVSTAPTSVHISCEDTSRSGRNAIYLRPRSGRSQEQRLPTFWVRNQREERYLLRSPTPASSGTYTCRHGNRRHSIEVSFEDIRCPLPVDHLHGEWRRLWKAGANQYDYAVYLFRETVNLVCDLGYVRVGSKVCTCSYTGEWTPPLRRSSCIRA